MSRVPVTTVAASLMGDARPHSKLQYTLQRITLSRHTSAPDCRQRPACVFHVAGSYVVKAPTCLLGQ